MTHVHALRGEPLRNARAYPVRTPGHQGSQPVEFHHGIVCSGHDILTTLEGQDTPGKVRALCTKARRVERPC